MNVIETDNNILLTNIKYESFFPGVTGIFTDKNVITFGTITKIARMRIVIIINLKEISKW